MFETANLLIESGTNIHGNNKDGWIALYCVTLYDRLEVVRLLLDFEIFGYGGQNSITSGILAALS